MKDKIPFYNIVNMFFVGAVFTFFSVVTFYKKIPIDKIISYSDFLSDWSIIIGVVLLVIMFEFGFIINRMGSIIVAPILSKLKIWKKDPYGIDVSKISQRNQKFQSMITEYVLMRSHIMMFLILLVMSLICLNFILSIFFLSMIVVFIFGGKKHNDKINIIRKHYHKEEEKERETEKKFEESISL